MDWIRVTCPETRRLEQIKYDDHPLGRLILGCSRFEERPIRCSRRCAALLDQVDRCRTDVEVVCASADVTGLHRIRLHR